MRDAALNMATPRFLRVVGGFGGWDLENGWISPQLGELNPDHNETLNGQSSLPHIKPRLELLTSAFQLLHSSFEVVNKKLDLRAYRHQAT